MADIECLLCNAKLLSDKSQSRYADHLLKEHNVILNKDLIIRETAKEKVDSQVEKHSENDSKLSGVVVKKIPWYAGCEYVCKFKNCGKMYFYEKLLQDHITKSHCTLDEYLAVYIRYETKAALVECQLCNKEVKRNWDSVSNHLSAYHKEMKMVDYPLKFNIPQEYTVSSMKLPSKEECTKYNYIIYSLKASTEPQDSKKIGEGEDSNKKKTVTAPVAQNTTEAKEADPSLPWYCKSEFHCGICSKTFYDIKNVMKHAAENHKLSKKEYYARFKDSFPDLAWYKCQICSQIIKHQYSTISKHLEKEHNIKVSEYEANYHKHLETIQMEKETTPPESQSKDTQIQMRCEMNLPWYSRTKFQCALCVQTFFDTMDLTTHTASDHQITKAQYRKKYGDTFPAVFYYTCQICSSEVKHQYSSIATHLKSEHDFDEYTGMDEYTKKFHSEDDTTTMQMEEQPTSGVNQTLEAPSLSYCKTEFKCIPCSSIFFDARELIRHSILDHNLSKKAYCEKYGDVSFPEVTWHKCNICFAQVKNQKSSLARHMFKFHGMTKEDYEAKYLPITEPRIQDKEIRVKSEPVITLSSNYENFTVIPSHVTEDRVASIPDFDNSTKLDSLHIKYIPDDDIPPMVDNTIRLKRKGNVKIRVSNPKRLRLQRKRESLETSNDTETFETWSLGRCQYDCAICQYIGYTSSTIWRHIKDVHSLTIEEYRNQHGHPCTSLRKITCFACNKSIRHDPSDLKKHAKNEHHMMLRRFYETCVKAEPSFEQVKIECQEQTDVEHYRSDNEDGFKTWTNGSCKYQCKSCDFKTGTSNDIWSHIKTAHNMEEDVYRKRHGDPCSLLKMIQCKACFKMLLHDPNAMEKHSLEDHEMGLRTFYDTFFRPLNTF